MDYGVQVISDANWLSSVEPLKRKGEGVTSTASSGFSLHRGRGIILYSGMRPSSLSRWIAAFFTAVMGGIPWPEIWQSLYGSPMEDRRVYAMQVASGYLSFDVATYESPIAYITGEYLWGWVLNLLVRTIGLSADASFAVISWFVVFTAARVILRHAPPIYLLMLWNPIFIDLAFSQMRIALAIAVASWAYLIRRRSGIAHTLRAIVLVAASAMHTSAFVFIWLFIVCWHIATRLMVRRPGLGYAALVLSGTLAAMALGPWRNAILLLIGDRRVSVEYDSSSIKFYLVWAIVLVILTIDWREHALNALSAYSLAVLVSALMGVAVGSYSNRVIAVSLPAIIVAISSISARWRSFAVLAYVGYVVIYWFYWLRLIV